MRKIKIGKIIIGENEPICLIAGPCVIENEKETINIGFEIKKITSELKIPYIFKASYDKANRSSINSFRGPGLKNGLKILAKVKKELKVPILSDVHSEAEIPYAQEVLDIIQIPAFLSRQTDLILTAAKTDKIINVKKGQFLAPWDVKNIIEKIEFVGNHNILITERGTCFGYNNLVVDFKSILIMQKFGYPIVFDATHSVQLPGGKGKSSGGEREYVLYLAKAAVAVGCDALFMEIHNCPEKALCDGPNSLNLKELKSLLKIVKKIEITRKIST